jgi:membrane protease subunit HflK
MAARLLEEAEGYRQNVVATAEGDAARFNSVLSEYAKAPKVMRDRLYFDMMQQVMSNTTKVLVDQKGGNNLLYLPLDKLIQQSSVAAPSLQSGSATQPAEVPPVVAPVAPSSSGSTSRDVTRGRN